MVLFKNIKTLGGWRCAPDPTWGAVGPQAGGKGIAAPSQSLTFALSPSGLKLQPFGPRN